MVAELAKKKEEWAYLDLSKKIAILREISDRVGERQVGEKIAMEHMKARKIDPTTPQGMNVQPMNHRTLIVASPSSSSLLVGQVLQGGRSSRGTCLESWASPPTPAPTYEWALKSFELQAKPHPRPLLTLPRPLARVTAVPGLKMSQYATSAKTLLRAVEAT